MQRTDGVQPARAATHGGTACGPLPLRCRNRYTFTHGSSLHTDTEAVMLIKMTTAPQGQDPHVVIAWIRACIWAGIEGWPFCPLESR